jgi:protocatechuate 3,4-dioxygenase beta subunit
MKPDPIRRNLVFGVAVTLVVGPAWAGRLLPTPRQTAGPFYPLELPLDHDNDLTRVRGQAGVARGVPADVSGRLLDLDGRPLRGARIEIWQCDANGRYHHPHDTGGVIDAGFQGFGQTVTDADGRYRFRTIRPVPYPGRTPHIHFAVLPDGAPRFTTQLYVKDEPRNAQDFLFNHIPSERRGLVVAEFVPLPGRDAGLSARFDIVLGGADGTPPG